MMPIIAASRLRGLPSSIAIGGVASVITNAQTLANYLTVSVNSVQSFRIVGDTVLADIINEYEIGATALTFEDNSDIRYFNQDIGGISEGFTRYFAKSSVFYVTSKTEGSCSSDQMYEGSNIKYGFFENADTLRGYKCFAELKNTRLYLGNLQFLDRIVGGSNSPFSASEKVKVYVPPNAPNIPDPSYTKIKIQNTTTPSSVTDLSVSEIGSTYLKLNFTEISNADFYEVWIFRNSVWEIIGEISGSDQYITGLNSQTNYQIRIATCDQYWNGSGFFEDTEKRALSNTINVTTTTTPAIFQNAVAYYKLDETSGDPIDFVKGYNGTLSGTINRDGEWYDYGTNESYVEIQNNDDFSFVDSQVNNTDFVIKTEIIFDGFNSRNRAWLVSKREKLNINTGDEWQFAYNNNDLVFSIWDNSNIFYSVRSNITPTIGQKYILGVTFINDQLRLFIDGVVVATENVPQSVTFNKSSSVVKLGNETFTKKLNLVGRQKETTIIKGSGWTNQKILDNYNNGNGITYQ